MTSTASRITKSSSLVKQLAAIPRVGTSRTNIVSPDLCDDVIQRLAPSLARYIGCTIIDINPGIGLWSSKIHDYLKPRNHILMEPKQNIYLPFLQPLLDAPGSRYCLKDWPDSDLWQPKRYVEEGLLHDAEGHGGPPPTTREPNNLILIIANVARQRRKFSGDPRFSTVAHRKALDFSRDVRHRSGFQTYGPTRMLMWLLEEEKRSLLPRTVGYRRKLSVSVEGSFHLEQIVGFPHTAEVGMHREDALDVESSRRVAKRMQENGVKIPPHRRVRSEDKMSDLSGVARYWHKELQELTEAFQAGGFKKYEERPAATSDEGHTLGTNNRESTCQKSQTLTPQYEKMVTLRGVAKGQNATDDKIDKTLKTQEKIDKMDLDLHRENIKPSEQEEISNALDFSIREYNSELESKPAKYQRQVRFRDDDRRAFAMDPPLLMWDRRRAEPLLARKQEFYPAGQMDLLDFQAKTTDDLPMTLEQSIYFDLITTFIFAATTDQATSKHLNTMAPGAFEALVPRVPALRDPRKGGRRDIGSVRTRTMTPEMFHGLAVAWENWTFKPPIEAALTRGHNLGSLERIGSITKVMQS